MSDQKKLLLLDAHVHFYDCFDHRKFLDSAYANFQRQSRLLDSEDRFLGVLLLSEGSSEHWFSRLLDYSNRETGSSSTADEDWVIEKTEESMSLVARRDQARKLIIIAGRQIATSERLEVLALCTEQPFADGRSTGETLRQVNQAGGVAVVPWGAGKWLGRRAGLLRELMEEGDCGRFFLGDNSARPVFWRNPAHFEIARKLGMKILPGTDPLPFESEVWRPGSFGFAMHADLSLETPARELKSLFADPETRFEPYGELEGPVRFFRNQLAMQIRKHLS